MEIGIGIHGEPGRRREKLAPADDIAGCSSSRSSATSAWSAGEQVLAFVNGMGGTPLIELYLAYNSVAKILDEHGIGIGRSLVGELHHQPGDGRVLGHAPAPGRRADVAVGRTGPYGRPALGRLT